MRQHPSFLFNFCLPSSPEIQRRQVKDEKQGDEVDGRQRASDFHWLSEAVGTVTGGGKLVKNSAKKSMAQNVSPPEVG